MFNKFSIIQKVSNFENFKFKKKKKKTFLIYTY